MRVYISGPLQSAIDLKAARELYEYAGDICELCGITPYLPHQNTDPIHHADASDLAVFDRDCSALREADLILAFVGRPSSGVGAEIAMACGMSKRIIAASHVNESPSRFLRGLLACYPQAVVLTYHDKNHLRSLLQRELSFLIRDTEDTDRSVGCSSASDR